MSEYHEMLEGPKHLPHVRQVQVGWLGQSGTFYSWPAAPTRDEEPGSYGPVFIDEEEGPPLLPLTSEVELETLRSIARRLADGWQPDVVMLRKGGEQVGVKRPITGWRRCFSPREREPMTPDQVHVIYGTEEESTG